MFCKKIFVLFYIQCRNHTLIFIDWKLEFFFEKKTDSNKRTFSKSQSVSIQIFRPCPDTLIKRNHSSFDPQLISDETLRETSAAFPQSLPIERLLFSPDYEKNEHTHESKNSRKSSFYKWKKFRVLFLSAIVRATYFPGRSFPCLWLEIQFRVARSEINFRLMPSAISHLVFSSPFVRTDRRSRPSSLCRDNRWRLYNGVVNLTAEPI